MASLESFNAAMDSDIENANAGPVNVTPTKRSANLRHGGLDNKLFASLSASSPSQAKKALEAHIADTDRRIREASKLGTSLLEQKKLLADHLKDVESQTTSEEVGPELRQKLANLEKEYNDLGRESARAFLPRSRRSGLFAEGIDDSQSAGQRPPSPSKLAVLPNTNSPRKHRNASSRTDDLAFATEISTSLLSQLRHLQNMLAEKEDALRDANVKNAQLTSDAEASSFRLRTLDENEQRYKDENWNLETQVQDLTTQLKDASTREQKLIQSLKTADNEKAAVERESDDVKLANDKLTEEHAALRKKHDAELSTLRRNVAAAETEKQVLNKKVADLSSQNEELAKAVSYRANADQTDQDRDMSSEAEFFEADNISPDGSPPPSPTKGTPRPGGLESETIKSSLHHAHRMIQNLKNNIHREKTEKVELRRLLQDARDEVEARRADSSNNSANLGKRRKPNSQPELFKKPSHINKLGAAKSSTDEIINDPAWEEYEESPTRDRGLFKRDSTLLSTDQSEGFETANETDNNANETDGFETATERGSNANETDAFESAHSEAGHDSEGDLTETETSQGMGNVRQSLRDRGPAVRSSFQSTASDDADIYDFQSSSFNSSSQPPRYKLKLGRGGLRTSETPSARDSPASYISNQSTPVAHQDLAAELEDIGDEASVAGSTPGRSIPSATPSPELERKRDTIVARTPESVASKPTVNTAGTMTDPWEPQPVSLNTVDALAADDVISDQDHINSLAVQRELTTKKSAESVIRRDAVESDAPDLPSGVDNADLSKVIPLVMSSIISQQTEPIAPEPPAQYDQASLMGSPALADPILPRMSGSTVARVASSIAPETVIDPTEIEERDMLPSSPAMQNGLFISRSEISHAEHEPPPVITADDTITATPFANVRSPVKDEGTQTTVSSEQIENLIKDKNHRSISVGTPAATPPRPSPARALSTGSKSTEPSAMLDPPNRSPRRPGSAGSLARSIGSPPTKEAPPLPAGHREVIAALSKTGSTSGTMPPPALPASPARNFSQPMRPQSPMSQASAVAGPSNYAAAIDGASTTTRSKPPSVAGRSDVTRRTSVSSFASEVEDRFKPGSVYPAGEYGFEPGADPRMIQAITQTMIGEFMYKYTRKAGRGDHSENRHRRFFWIHPYTRTLYWSTRDPARAGRMELKAKSVPIEAVRVVFDDNPTPPGLHNKSIVIVTPSRNIKLTAPTSHRHDTWFNALSYLLMRNNPNDREADLTAHARPYTSSSSRPRTKSRADSLTADDVSEFNPTLVNRPSVRGTGSTGSVIRASGSAATRMSGASMQNHPGFASPQRNIPSTPEGIMAALGSASQRSLDSQEPQGTPTPVRTTLDADGFKKPMRPASTVVADAPQLSTPTHSNSMGRKSSFTNRLSLFGRSRSSTHLSRRSPSPMQAQTAPDGSSATSTGQPSSIVRSSSVDRAGITQASSDTGIEQSPTLERSNSTLENVRACCDGKHDVGNLSHTHFSSLSQRHSRATSANTTKSHSRVSLSMGGRH